jgi:hypothetical protein
VGIRRFRSIDLLLGRAAFETAKDVIEYRKGAMVLNKSGGEGGCNPSGPTTVEGRGAARPLSRGGYGGQRETWPQGHLGASTGLVVALPLPVQCYRPKR